MAFPTTAVLDNFNRTENPLSDGGRWATSAGPFADSVLKANGSQALSTVATGTYSGSAWNTAFALPVEVYVDVPTAPGAGNWIDIYWIQNPTAASTSGYRVSMQTTRLVIERYDNGNQVVLLNDNSFTMASGDSLGMSISLAGLITAWHKTGGSWSSPDSTTDTTYVGGGGYIAIDTNDSTTLFDNFGGGFSGPNPISPLVAGVYMKQGGR